MRGSGPFLLRRMEFGVLRDVAFLVRGATRSTVPASRAGPPSQGGVSVTRKRMTALVTGVLTLFAILVAGSASPAAAGTRVTGVTPDGTRVTGQPRPISELQGSAGVLDVYDCATYYVCLY